MRRHSRCARRRRAPIAHVALATGAAAIGALAVGAMTIGALAISSLAIKRLARKMKPGPRGAGTRREGDYRFDEAGAAAGFAAERLLRRWRRVDLFTAGFAVLWADAALADGAGFDFAGACGAAGLAAKAAADRIPEAASVARAASFFMIQ